MNHNVRISFRPLSPFSPPSGDGGTCYISPRKAAEPLTPRWAVRLLTGDREKHSDEERRFIAALLDRSPTIATAVALVGRFATMVKD